MTILYLIRHAEAEGNIFSRAHGQYDSPVTQKGREQIAYLERRFAGIPVDAVYSSDLLRTRQTAEAIYIPKNLELHTVPQLREFSLGEWEDKPLGELLMTHPKEMDALSAGALDYCPPGGENLGQVLDRAERALREIAAAHPGQSVAVVSHGTVIRLLLTKLTHSPTYFKEGVNTAVSRLEFDGETLRVAWSNDASHLPPEMLQKVARPQLSTKPEEGQTSMGPVWFRPWDPQGEQERYLEYRREGWMSSHGAMEHFDGPAFLRAALAHSACDPKAVLVVMSGQNPVGMLELDLEKDAAQGVGFIPFYYLDPEHRGQGGGVQLLGQAVSVYRGLGRTKLRLRCAPENETAYRFYCRMGFQKTGMAQTEPVPLYLMERKI